MYYSNYIILLEIFIIIVLLIILFKYIVSSYIAKFMYIDTKWEKIKEKYKDMQITYPIKNKVIIFTSYNKSFKNTQSYIKDQEELLKKYSKLHGYEYKNFVHEDNELSPYWLRVKDLKYLSSIYPENTIFVYFDTDAVIRPEYFHISIEKMIYIIESIKNKKYSFFIGDDISSIISYNTLMNSGVMIIKNNEWFKNWINIWFLSYDDGSWRYEDKKWLCKIENKKKCAWARDKYEQGMINILYIENKYKEKDNILILNQSVLSNAYQNNDSFILHLMGSQNKIRNKVFNEMKNKII